MGDDREGHPVWYDHFSYDFRGNYICTLFKIHSRHTHKIYIYTSISNSFFNGYRTILFSEDG